MIPKKIHYCWVGGKPLPESAQRYIRSWRKHCPDYEIIEWNENNYDFTKNEYMKEAYEARKWGFVPDYARLDIIFQHGGIYLDTDVQVLRSFDSLLSNQAFLGFEDDRHINLGLGFGAEKGHRAIKLLMDSYEKMHFRNSDGSLNIIASPELNTEMFLKHGLIPDGHHQNVLGVEILPTDYLCPKSFVTGLTTITENTFSIHQFDASWLDETSQQNIQQRWTRHRQKARRRRIRAFIHSLANLVLSEKMYQRVKSWLGLQ